MEKSGERSQAVDQVPSAGQCMAADAGGVLMCLT